MWAHFGALEKELEVTLLVQWIPGHAGLAGNEAADAGEGCARAECYVALHRRPTTRQHVWGGDVGWRGREGPG